MAEIGAGTTEGGTLIIQFQFGWRAERHSPELLKRSLVPVN
jgi:hypothetical protein